MANFYSNETPAGVIDGTNKEYTTAKTINTIITVIVDGLIYSGGITYTPETNIFTLDDAPTVSIEVSYFDSASGAMLSNGSLVADVRKAYERRKQDLSNVGVAVFYDWCNEINYFIYDYIKNNNPDKFLSSGYYVASNGGQPLPSDYDCLNSIGTGFYLLDGNGVPTEQKLTRTAFGSNENGYYISGDNVVFTGGIIGQSYALRYIPALAEITKSSDYLILPKKWMRYILNALDVCYTIWDDDTQSEYSADQRFANSLSYILENFSSESEDISLQTNYNCF